MKRLKSSIKKAIYLLGTICLLYFVLVIPIHASEGQFEGKGTYEEPYLIKDKNDLLLLAKRVNIDHEEFRDEFFKQECDINLKDILWEPIGIFDSGHYFFGYYDGNGHVLNNLIIKRDDNAGFFGQLGGACINLGIESGEIIGACVGAISSHSASDDALILNCYNKANLSGVRAGGIVDNFKGSVINSWSDCGLEGDMVGGITSYSVDTAYGCYSTAKNLGKIVNGDNNNKVSEIIGEEICKSLNTNKYKQTLSDYTMLNNWDMLPDGRVCFGDKNKQSLREYLTSIDCFFKGSGTKEKPYIIETEDDFIALSELVNYGNESFWEEWIRQDDDLDLSDYKIAPIGICGMGTYFYGVYDGNGHTISSLNIERTDDCGLFGTLGGVCMNLGIESGTIKGANVGAFCCNAATTKARIVNCYNKADVIGNRASGIADNFKGIIYNCVSDCKLEGNIIGGITVVSPNSILYCYSNNTLSYYGNYTGEGSEQILGDDGFEKKLRTLNSNTYRSISNKIGTEDMFRWKCKSDGSVIFDSKNSSNVIKKIIKNYYIVVPYLMIIFIALAMAIEWFLLKREQIKKHD